MNARSGLLTSLMVGAALLLPVVVRTQGGDATPPPPVFHHLHLNSVDPAAAIAGYLQLWPATTRQVRVAGFDALENGRVHLLFTKVDRPAPVRPQSAYRHQVWLTANVREYVARARAHGMQLDPLYTSDEGAIVDVSTDTFPGTLTKTELAAARAKGVTPTRQAGYTYVRGPEGQVVEGFERAGAMDRLAQIDMWQEDPICAELWYAAHLGGSRRNPAQGAAPTEATCKVAAGEPTWPSTLREGTRRTPVGRVGYGEIALLWYTRPGPEPLVGTLGQGVDHLAFAVTNLDAWLAKLRRENVKILREPYSFGTSRAFMIEGPSREAIEILEQQL
jgi:catechol 2,3-dioxygenase-like lactoylglutathione lyase family enzyme